VTTTALSGARAHATGAAADAVAALTESLTAQLGTAPAAAVFFFASTAYAPDDVVHPLADAFPAAVVVGCSTAGEFTDRVTGTHGISAVALPEGIVAARYAALADLSQDVAGSVRAAVAELERQAGRPLRELDSQRWLGLTLIDGMHGAEEEVNEQLGNAAPLLDFVGGSAGDDLGFAATWVSVGHEVSWQGAAFLLVESGVPFRVVKTCSFTPAGHTLRVTRCEPETRTVWEFDGRPAVEAYAEALGLSPEQVDSSAFLAHPVGLMVDGAPFIRSPQQVVEGGGIRFYCQMVEGMDVEVMTAGDVVADTASALKDVHDDLGGASAAIYFNCILRRLQLDAAAAGEQFVDALGATPAAGFHTYGETWLGHINQTLTGVVFGPR